MKRPLSLIFFLFVTAIFLVGTSTAALSSDSFQVAGVVVNANNGSPVGRCQVMIRAAPSEDAHTMSKPMSMTTAEDGRFLFNDVAEGKYALVARRNGYRVQPLNEHDGFTSAVVVGPNKDSQNVIFRLQPSASISGRIEDEFGDPVAGAQVSLFRRAPLQGKTLTYPRGRTNTNNEGVYHFYRLPPGEYFVVVLARPWYTQYQPYRSLQNDDRSMPKQEDGEANLDVAFPLTYYPGVMDSASATSIKLLPGDRFLADMKLNSQAALHFLTVKPVSEESKPAEQHLTSTVFSMQMNMDPALRTVRDGKTTEFTGVPSGHYSLRQITPGTDAPADETRQEVEVSANGNVEYRKATEGTPVTGKITLEGANEPLRDTIIQFDQGDGHALMQAHSTPDGEFVPFKLFPGQYQYSAFSKQGVIKSFKATGAKVVGRTIEVGTSPVSLNVTMADVAVVIEGTVHSSDGKPVSGAMVLLIPEDPDHNENIFRRDQSDSDGSFMLKVVMPGRYMLVAIDDGWDLEWSKIEVMRRFLAQGEAIEIVPSQDVTTKVLVQSAR